MMDIDLYQISALVLSTGVFIVCIGWVTRRSAKHSEEKNDRKIMKVPVPHATGLTSRLNELDTAMFSPSMQPRQRDTWPVYDHRKMIEHKQPDVREKK